MMPPEPITGRRRWFAADGCHLAIDEPDAAIDPAVRTLGDAVLLGVHDELLERVHRWTGIDHDWAPLDTPSEPPALTHSVASCGEGALEVGVVLDAALLARLEPSRAARVDGVRIEAHAVHARLRLDRLMLTADEREHLVPGSLMLLPASFAEHWIGALECGPAAGSAAPVDDARTATAFVQPGSGLLYFRGWEDDAHDETRADDAAFPCTVHLATAVPIALDAWLAAEPADGTCAMTDGFRRPRLDVGLGERIVPATLVPVGDGYAALLEEPTWT